MNERQTCFQLNELARRLRSVPPAPHNPNLYFVMVGGNVILATTIFNVANNLFESYVKARSKDSAVLADRRIGDLANYYPATGLSLDARNTDYYQAQKYGVTEERVREFREEGVREKQEAEAHVKILSKPGQWISIHRCSVDVYFFIRRVSKDGELHGCQITVNHKAKVLDTQSNTIAKNMLQFWKLTYNETVRDLGLESYL